MAITAPSSSPTGARSREAQDPSWAGILQRIEAEYVEMPGLTLTGRQAARLWGLDVRQVERLLSELIERGFLMRDRRGAYRRRGCPRCS